MLGEEINDKKLAAAAEKYRKTVNTLERGVTRDEEEAFESAASDCGVVPDPEVECETLVTDDEATALLGGELSETQTGTSGCAWVGPETEAGDSNSLAVEVYSSRFAYERLTGQLAGVGEPVAGLGDEAVALEGFSSQTLGSTCGRTVVALLGERTLQVALCLGDTPVTIDQVVAVAQQAAGRL